jgi:hypothetical protein
MDVLLYVVENDLPEERSAQYTTVTMMAVAYAHQRRDADEKMTTHGRR